MSTRRAGRSHDRSLAARPFPHVIIPRLLRENLGSVEDCSLAQIAETWDELHKQDMKEESQRA
ncbi:hypothetical protein E2C01_040005 [Portunus trituberculatus]|uniref:Uncharacterized protein n=1 Tax=Portunus trituberculatus TaxID=210409 RepID=A0A5B7FM55_PORTR|nr:hypothetical protein [Portunus trituberculatus]